MVFWAGVSGGASEGEPRQVSATPPVHARSFLQATRELAESTGDGQDPTNIARSNRGTAPGRGRPCGNERNLGPPGKLGPPGNQTTPRTAGGPHIYLRRWIRQPDHQPATIGGWHHLGSGGGTRSGRGQHGATRESNHVPQESNHLPNSRCRTSIYTDGFVGQGIDRQQSRGGTIWGSGSAGLIGAL